MIRNHLMKLVLGLACVVLLGTELVTAAEPMVLRVTTEKVLVDGKEAEVFAILGPDGKHGATLEQKEGFHVVVKNELSVPTSIHWHGLVLPNAQDGVPFLTQDPIPPGGSHEYNFPLQEHGTYWMHSHYGLQEQALTSAPMIIQNEEERAKADQEVVMFISDFSFKTPGEILKGLMTPEKMEMKPAGGMGMMKKAMVPVRVQTWDGLKFSSTVAERPAVDIDVKYGALLTNWRSMADPEVVPVEANKTVLLRIIAASSATNFWIDTGGLEAELLAVDGRGVVPLKGNFFQLGVAQRIDLRVKIPAKGGAFPILALGEGTTLQTGLVLATKGAVAPKLPGTVAQMAGALDNTQEKLLKATEPLAAKEVTRPLNSVLSGSMANYSWTINGKSYPNRDSLDVKEGDRAEMTLVNLNMMSHPMHLHGHSFQVTEIDGKDVSGAMRDTILVPPGSTMKIQFDASNPGLWAYHCHILYHLATGMFTVVKYPGADEKYWQPEKTAIELQEKLP